MKSDEATDPTTPEIERHGAAMGRGLGLADLRAALDDAIAARAWKSVEAIHDRIREAERVDVIDLDAERAKRGGK